MMCCGCSTPSNTIQEHCLESVVTYQDLVECVIRLEKIGFADDDEMIALTLSDLATDEKMQKMIDVLNHGVTTEDDINYACVAIDRGDEIEYTVS